MAVDYASAIIEYGGTPNTTTLLELTKKLAGVVGSQQDDEYTLYLQMAGEAAESYCDNKLVSQSTNQLHVQLDTPVSLRFYPVTELTTVVVDGEDVTADYSLYTVDGISFIERTQWEAAQTETITQATITYQAGYDPVPAEVGYAIARSAVDYQKDNPQEASRVKKETVVGVGSLEYDLDQWKGEYGILTSETLTILDRYKRLHA